MSLADLSEPLRSALVNNAGISALLPTYIGSKAVFTRRPTAADAPYPMIVVPSDISVENEDGISDPRPIHTRTITAWGKNDTPANYRVAETIAYLVRDLFHRNRRAITVLGWAVADIRAIGPTPVFSDNQTIGFMVTLEIRVVQS